MKSVFLKSFVAVAVLASTGCISPPKLETASGKPEISVAGKPAKTVLAFVTNEFVNQGYTIRGRSEMKAVFDKPLEGAAKFMYSGPGLADPVLRVTLDFVDLDTQTRVLGKLHFVSNPGGAKGVPEKADEVVDKIWYTQLQDQLTAIRDKLK
jgi:hypothetical protein